MIFKLFSILEVGFVMWKRLSRIQLVPLDPSKALQKICMMMVTSVESTVFFIFD